MPVTNALDNKPDKPKSKPNTTLILLISLGVGSLCPLLLWLNLDLDKKSIFSPFFFDLHADHPELILSYLVPLISTILTWYFIRRIKEDAAYNSLLAEQLAKKTDDLTLIKKQLNCAMDEVEQVKEHYVRTTTQMRIRLAQMFSLNKNPKHITLFDVLDLDILQELQNSFASAFRLGMSIRDPEAELLTRPSNPADACAIARSTSLGKKACFWFQRNIVEKAARHQQPVFKFCTSCGLMCGGVPIIVADRHVGTWMIGMIRTNDCDEQQLAKHVKQLDIDPDKILAARKTAELMTIEQYKASLDLLWSISKKISSLGYKNLQLAREIVKRKQAEYDAQFAWQALNNVDQGIIWITSDSKIFALNDTICSMLQYTRRELLNKNVQEIAEIDTSDLHSLQQGWETSKQLTFRTCEKTSICLYVKSSVFEIRDKKFSCLVASFNPDDKLLPDDSIPESSSQPIVNS